MRLDWKSLIVVLLIVAPWAFATIFGILPLTLGIGLGLYGLVALGLTPVFQHWCQSTMTSTKPSFALVVFLSIVWLPLLVVCGLAVLYFLIFSFDESLEEAVEEDFGPFIIT